MRVFFRVISHSSKLTINEGSRTFQEKFKTHWGVGFLLKHNILRFEISVSDALRVKILYGRLDVAEKTSYLRLSQSTAVLRFIQDLDRNHCKR